MRINLKNVEEIIFFDKNVHKILPEFRHFFDQWNLGNITSALSNLASKSVFDLLNSLKEEQIKKLEVYFGTSVVVEKLEHGIVKHISINTNDSLCGFTEFKDFCLARNKDKVFLTFWR